MAQWIEFFVPAHLKTNPEHHSRARLTVTLFLTITTFAPLFSIAHYLADAPPALTLTPLIAFLSGPICLFLVRQYGAVRIASNIYVASYVFATLVSICNTGGLESPLLILCVLYPATFVYILKIQDGAIWTALLLLCILGVGALQTWGLLTTDPRAVHFIPPKDQLIFASTVISFILSGLFEISRSRLHRQSLQDQRSVLEASKMASIGEIAAGVAHEINNPLAIASMNLSFLAEERKTPELDEARAKRFDSIQKAHGRISDIVSALCVFAGKDHQAHQRSQTFSLRKSVNTAVLICKGLPDSAVLSIEIDLPTEDLKAIGSETEASRILYCLIRNAIEATRNLKSPVIRISVRPENNFLAVSVTNSGPPIPKEIRPSLFLPHFSTKKAHSGSGITLANSLEMAKALDGDLSYDESHPETCFTLRLRQASP